MHMNPNSARRILIVDNDPQMVAEIASALQSLGYITTEATSSKQAIQLAHDFMPDLAILEVNMEDMSGLELANYFYVSTNIHFMFISAQAETAIVKQAAQFGAAGYLLKPFSIAQLIPAFETALCRANEIRMLRQEEKILINAINSGREVGIAVGLLMAKFQTDRNSAFEVLRSYSRSRRCKLNVVVEQLMEAEEMLNSFKILFTKMDMKTDRTLQKDHSSISVEASRKST